MKRLEDTRLAALTERGKKGREKEEEKKRSPPFPNKTRYVVTKKGKKRH